MENREKLFMAALAWLHNGILFAGLFLIPAALPGQQGKTGLLTACGLVLGGVSALSWVCLRRLRSPFLYAAAALAISGAAAALGFGLTAASALSGASSAASGSALSGLASAASASPLSAFVPAVWQLVLPAAVFLCALLFFGMRAADKIRRNRAAAALRDMPGLLPEQESTELAAILDAPAPWHMAFLILVYLWAVTQDVQTVWNRVFQLLLTDLFVCLAWNYLNRMDEFIQAHRHVARLPVRTMKHTGIGILGFLAVCLALLVLPAALYGKEPLADIRLPRGGFTVPVETETLETSAVMEGFSMAELLGEEMPPKEMPLWLENTLTALAIGMSAAAAVLLLRQLCRILKDAIRSFGEEGQEEITFLGDNPEKGESLRRRLGRRRQERRSPDGQIRRLYRQEIRRGLKKSAKEKKAVLNGTETPSQAEEKAGLTGQTSPLARDYRELLHRSYERARYQGGCTGEALGELTALRKKSTENPIRHGSHERQNQIKLK